MRLKRIVLEATPIPRGYGFAWFNIDSLSFMVYPVPLNVILGRCRLLWVRLVRFGVESDPVLQAYRAGFEHGHSVGRELHRLEDEQVGFLRLAAELRSAFHDGEETRH